MPRRSKRSRRTIEESDEEEEEDVKIPIPSPSRSRKRRQIVESQTQDMSQEEEEAANDENQSEDDEEDDEMDRTHDFALSQQAPEASQSILAEKPNERRNLESMGKAEREKAITALSRLILFRALDQEPLNRLQLAKMAGIDQERITNAAFQEASTRLKHVFGFELRRIPMYMEGHKGLAKKYKDRLYVLNAIADSADGEHCKRIHSIHQGPAIEKGLLLLVLSLIFCKGDSRSDGSRWILGRDLYRLLHNIDENIHPEPPEQGTTRAKQASAASSSASLSMSRTQSQQNITPDVDGLLERFVHRDYLMKEKATEENFSSQTLEEGDLIYSMGPRAAMEVGRKQVIYFCAEILDEEPCPTMLKEVEEDLEEDGDEEPTQTQEGMSFHGSQ